MLIYVKDVEAINSSVFHRYTSTLIDTLKSYNLTTPSVPFFLSCLKSQTF